MRWTWAPTIAASASEGCGSSLHKRPSAVPSPCSSTQPRRTTHISPGGEEVEVKRRGQFLPKDPESGSSPTLSWNVSPESQFLRLNLPCTRGGGFQGTKIRAECERLVGYALGTAV